ncbi:hypothetical protein NW757_004401 [Fusarium falciforme]|nr:hypothetical protein NW757_004401 [Fusarium falciforme]
MAKFIFITGCSAGGIGPALAREFHSRGHHVMASGRTASEIDPALSPLGITTLVLVNNAGVIHVTPFADEPVAEAYPSLQSKQAVSEVHDSTTQRAS